MVFRTLYVGKDRVLATVTGDQSHGDSGYRGLDRHATVHHRQGPGANAAHRCRSVRAEGLGYQSDGVREVGLAGNDRLQSPFCKRTVTNLASTRKAETSCLACGVRGEVVVVNEVFFGFETVCIKPLSLACRCKCESTKYLGFAPCKES